MFERYPLKSGISGVRDLHFCKVNVRRKIILSLCSCVLHLLVLLLVLVLKNWYLILRGKYQRQCLVVFKILSGYFKILKDFPSLLDYKLDCFSGKEEAELC